MDKNNPIKILIVDDLVDNLRFLSFTLTKENYQVRCAKNGEIALVAIENEIPDLILLDIKMPGISGFQVCEKLKASPKTAEIPIIFLTASDEIEDKVKAFQLGGADYISKPFQIEEILIRIRNQLTIKQASIEIKKLNQQLNVKIEQEITQKKRAEELVAKKEQELNCILESLEEIVLSAQLPEFQFIYVNSAAEEVYGRKTKEFFNNNNLWFEIIHPEDRMMVEQYIRKIPSFQKKYQHKIDFEYRIIRPSQEIRWVRQKSVVLFNENNTPFRIDGIIQDITEQKIIEEKLVYNAFHDTLTKLPNRQLFLEHLTRVIKHSQRYPDYLFAVLFIDLDRFKIINDSLGHSIGDQLLITFANLLKNCVRDNDIVGRIGGDEFTILLDGIQETKNAIEIVQRIQKELKNPLFLQGHTIFANASIGIVLNAKHHNRALDILRDADLAMYKAKQLGINGYSIFNQSMHEENLKLLETERDLRIALREQQFVLYYQPIFSLISGQLKGFEALIRWQHPQKGLILPKEFISLAENTGLISDIGEWVLKTGCIQLKQWQDKIPQTKNLTLSINVSSRQIRENNFLEIIDSVLTETGLDGKYLKLEITEKTLLENFDIIINLLSKVKQRNIQLNIDDFGTGYSSLSYLHQFPIETLKIDRSFVHNMDSNENNFQIVRTIVALAHAMNFGVIGEGVNTEKQLAQLKELKCEEGQGYLFSKPLDISSAESVILEQL